VRAIYPAGKTAFLRGQVDMVTDTIRAQLVSSAYDPNDTVITDVAGHVGVSVVLSGVTVTNGVADGDDIVFPDVTGEPVKAVVLYKDGGTLISYADQRADTLPIDITPNGGDITMTFQYLVKI